MQKRLALAIIAGVLSLAASSVLLQAANTVPATTTFRNATDVTTGDPLDRIRSDSFAPVYENGFYCVRSEVNGNGFFFRSQSYACTTATPSLAIRSVTLDFSQPVIAGCTSPTYVIDAYAGGALDICGSNLVPDVRILAGSLFASTAPTKGTPVTLVFSNPTNFSGPGGFELDFEQNVGVTVVSSTIRRMTASGTAIAELYQKEPPSGKKISLGRYYMPFSLTVAKQ